MATPSQALSGELKYDKLSGIYLSLWKQLDSLVEAGKWLEVRPESGAVLSELTRRDLHDLAPYVADAELWSGIQKDYEKTQELIFRGGHVVKTELDAFRDYLGDQALRYAQLSDDTTSVTAR